MKTSVPGMARVEQREDIWYIRHNLRRGSILCAGGATLVLISSLSLVYPDRGAAMWVLAAAIFFIGAGLIVLGGLALRERVTFRISLREDEVELTVRSGSDRRYRTRRSAVDRVLLELAPNAPRTANDGWSVRVSGFGEKMVVIAKGQERAMKTLARQLAADLGAELEEPRGFTSRHG